MKSHLLMMTGVALLGVLLAAPAATAQHRDRPHRPAVPHRPARVDPHARARAAHADAAAQAARAANARRHALHMNTAERRTLRDYYGEEAVHRDRIARLRRLYDLARAAGDEGRMREIEALYHRQHELHVAHQRRLAAQVGPRHELIDAAEDDLAPTRHDVGLERRRAGAADDRAERPGRPDDGRRGDRP